MFMIMNRLSPLFVLLAKLKSDVYSALFILEEKEAIIEKKKRSKS